MTLMATQGPAAVPLDRAGAHDLAARLLGDVGTRLRHVERAAQVAAHLGVLFDRDEAELLVAAATLHDIGYSPQVVRTGFHPLDGGRYLRALGYDERLAALVAHHSLAVLTADHHGVHDLEEQFPREESLLVDALVYADMHSAPDGRLIPARDRLDDIGARHTHSAVQRRAALLRASMARVGDALDRLGPVRDPRPSDRPRLVSALRPPRAASGGLLRG